MPHQISGSEFVLAKIFSAEFDYHIPSYQRPYSWTKEEASELFKDLADFHEAENEDGYFLGSIVLIKNDASPRAEVIDGQQRLTTLTILFAVLAAALPDDLKAEMLDHIVEAGQELKGIAPRPRLTLRSQDADFFQHFIQELRLKELAEQDQATLRSDSRRNIHANMIAMRELLALRFKGNADKIKAFVTFLLTRCYLIAVTTPSEQSAFRVFSVLNTRGLDLQPTDIIKADLIGKMTDETDRATYSRKWEDREVDLGRDGFSELFTALRMIRLKEKARRGLVDDFRNSMLPEIDDPRRFIDDEVIPHGEALDIIRSRSFLAENGADRINMLLGWLARIDNSDWVPLAMYVLKQQRTNPALVETYLSKLERLAACLLLTRQDVGKRITRYAQVLRALEKNGTLTPPIALDLTPQEKTLFMEALNGPIYELTARRRNYAILRLDSFLADGGAVYEPRVLTIEHVLPQTVREGSPWLDSWPDADRRAHWVHRIANLVPLNKRRNAAASNYGFEKKKDVYFRGRKNVSSYALTSQVLNDAVWTPELVEARQKRLMAVFTEGWELG